MSPNDLADVTSRLNSLQARGITVLAGVDQLGVGESSSSRACWHCTLLYSCGGKHPLL